MRPLIRFRTTGQNPNEVICSDTDAYSTRYPCCPRCKHDADPETWRSGQWNHCYYCEACVWWEPITARQFRHVTSLTGPIFLTVSEREQTSDSASATAADRQTGGVDS